MNDFHFNLIIIGGGAAGYFTAIQVKELNPEISICILEAGTEPLAKVRISGGGRCNVTHSEFDPKKLVKAYPRGQKELLGPFHQFHPKDMLEWLQGHGIHTHTEQDGRIFPKTNDSKTIVDLFQGLIKKFSVKLVTNTKVKNIKALESSFSIKTTDEQFFNSSSLMLATGGSPSGYKLAKKLGHKIMDLSPSLFSFKIKDKLLEDLSGISFSNVTMHIVVQGKKFNETGPILITHWGLSGPAIIKLSAWAAKELYVNHYQAEFQLDFFPDLTISELAKNLVSTINSSPKKSLNQSPFPSIPKRFWQGILRELEISAQKTYNQLNQSEQNSICVQLKMLNLSISGKGPFKEEFVTSGGVNLKEVHSKTFESKLIPNLFFAGEVLNIDGITGGFNFQSAWTTAFLAAKEIALKF